MLTKVCHAISYKIYLEYARSFDYHMVDYHQETPSIIVVNSTINAENNYNVNLLENECEGYRLVYLGIPCRHIYAEWRFTGKKFETHSLDSINQAWIIGATDANLKTKNVISTT